MLGYCNGVCLADIVHVQLAQHFDAIQTDTRFAQQILTVSGTVLNPLPQVNCIQFLQQLVDRHYPVVAHVRNDTA